MVTQLFSTCLFIFALSTAAAVSAADPFANQWTPDREADGVKLFRGASAFGDLTAFRAEGEIPAHPLAVLEAILDVSSHTRWVPDCAAADRIATYGPNHDRIVSQTRVSWPFDDRETVMDRTVWGDAANRTVRLVFHAIRDETVPAKNGTVRILNMQGGWLLTPAGPDRTHAVYVLDVDPGGGIPHALVDSTNARNVIKTITGLARTAIDPKYRAAAEKNRYWAEFETVSQTD